MYIAPSSDSSLLTLNTRVTVNRKWIQIVVYRAAWDEDYEEALEGAARADLPGQTDEEDDTQDILQARQEHAHQRTHLGRCLLADNRTYRILVTSTAHARTFS